MDVLLIPVDKVYREITKFTVCLGNKFKLINKEESQAATGGIFAELTTNPTTTIKTLYQQSYKGRHFTSLDLNFSCQMSWETLN